MRTRRDLAKVSNVHSFGSKVWSKKSKWNVPNYLRCFLRYLFLGGN
jgi:hypothetical protein